MDEKTSEITVRDALGILFEPGDTVELRCFGNGPPLRGYFRNGVDLVRAAEQVNDRYSIYVVANRLNPDLYHRCADRLEPARKDACAGNKDVTMLRWLAVDVDAVRPSGISASDEEKRQASLVAVDVCKYLADKLGKDCLVFADSGNGFHILIKLPDLSNNRETVLANKRVLKHLADKFNDDGVKIDQTMADPAQLIPCFGTMKRKGEDSAERPHRPTVVMKTPECIRPVDIAQLHALAPVLVASNGRPVSEPGDQIDKLLDARGIEYERQDDYEADSGEAAIKWVLKACPFDESHNDSAAYIIWFEAGNYAAGCHHDGCAGKGWREMAKELGYADPAAKFRQSISKQPPPPNSYSSLGSLSSYHPPSTPTSLFYGPLGEICQDLEKHSEASPVAVLLVSMMQFGVAVGRHAYAQLDEPHYPKLYVALVGPTGSGRKGTADTQALRIITSIDDQAERRQQYGLSTGEGVVRLLNDNREGLHPSAVAFTERELASVFRRSERRGNTLVAYIRDMWDNKPIGNQTAGDPVTIENHHVGLSAHITPAELCGLLSDIDISNGFANRFLWIYCRRTGRKPLVQGFSAAKYPRQLQQLRSALEAIKDLARQGGGSVELPFTLAARTAWLEKHYPELDIDSEEDTLLTLMCNRQPQQLVRLATIFAMMDGHTAIDVPHMDAGRAIVEYVRDGADYILSRPWWGNSKNVRDPAAMAPKLFEMMQDGKPRPRTFVVCNVFQKNRTAAEINNLRDYLVGQGQLTVTKDGRMELWQLSSR